MNEMKAPSYTMRHRDGIMKVLEGIINTRIRMRLP